MKLFLESFENLKPNDVCEWVNKSGLKQEQIVSITGSYDWIHVYYFSETAIILDHSFILTAKK